MLAFAEHTQPTAHHVEVSPPAGPDLRAPQSRALHQHDCRPLPRKRRSTNASELVQARFVAARPVPHWKALASGRAQLPAGLPNGPAHGRARALGDRPQQSTMRISRRRSSSSVALRAFRCRPPLRDRPTGYGGGCPRWAQSLNGQDLAVRNRELRSPTPQNQTGLLKGHDPNSPEPPCPCYPRRGGLRVRNRRCRSPGHRSRRHKSTRPSPRCSRPFRPTHWVWGL